MAEQQQQKLNFDLLKTIIGSLSQQGDLQDYTKKINILIQHLNKDELLKAQEQTVQFKSYIDTLFQQYQQEHSLNQMQLQPAKVKRLYVDGCFDLMHSGHFNALRQAKQFAETLVVGVISHEQVCSRKGTPILDYSERLTLAKSCKWVDEIYENAPYDATIELLDKLNCSHTAHGDDLIITPDGTDAYKPFKDAGRMIIFKRTEGISTTDIVGRLLLMTRKYNDKSFKKKIRKFSGEQGLKASKLKNIQDSSEDELQEQNSEVKNQNLQLNESQQQQTQSQQQDKQQKQEEQFKVTKIKMVNTTRRIRQFSSDHKEPKENDKIVYIDGSFDLLHIGHVKALEAAKKQGDYLIVGVHDDETINQIKGNNYPVLQLQERVLNLLALKYVDEVIIGAPYIVTEQLIKQFGIHLVVEGSQTAEQQPFNDEIKSDPYEVPKKMGIFKLIESDCDMTIDGIIERIFKNRMNYLEIYNKKATKQQNYYDTTQRVVKER